MGINYALLRSLTAREIITALFRDGFSFRPHGKGSSHKRYQHQDGRRVTVSFHKSSDTFPPKTMKDRIEHQDDLKRLKLIP